LPDVLDSGLSIGIKTVGEDLRSSPGHSSSVEGTGGVLDSEGLVQEVKVGDGFNKILQFR
jgi:hypothetical protein